MIAKWTVFCVVLLGFLAMILAQNQNDIKFQDGGDTKLEEHREYRYVNYYPADDDFNYVYGEQIFYYYRYFTSGSNTLQTSLFVSSVVLLLSLF